jgi:serine phosphatase RsbU (regulator of sigma subunit)
MMNERPEYHVEIDIEQKMPKSQVACGDVFVSKRIKEDGRTILVLSDGVGHGVKACVLASLTATMALNYATFHTKPDIAARIIMRALPKSSDGLENYATFTLIEIEADGKVKIINYDNPKTIILRGNNILNPNEYHLEIQGLKIQGKFFDAVSFNQERKTG